MRAAKGQNERFHHQNARHEVLGVRGLTFTGDLLAKIPGNAVQAVLESEGWNEDSSIFGDMQSLTPSQAIADLVARGRFTTLSIGGKILLKRSEVEEFKPKPPGPSPKAKPSGPGEPAKRAR